MAGVCVGGDGEFGRAGGWDLHAGGAGGGFGRECFGAGVVGLSAVDDSAGGADTAVTSRYVSAASIDASDYHHYDDHDHDHRGVAACTTARADLERTCIDVGDISLDPTSGDAT